MKRLYVILLTSCTVLVFNYECTKNNPVAPQEPTVTITSFSPQCGFVGEQIVIYGKGFDTNKANDKVFFTTTASSSKLAIAVVDSVVITDSISRIYAVVPALASTGPITVEINGYSGSSQASFKYASQISPVFKSFQPHSGAVGSIVTVTGTGFDQNIKNTNVMVDTASAQVVSASATQLQFRVPPGAANGPITMLMDCDSIVLQGAFTVVPDSILAFTPQGGDIGSLVTITTNFYPDTTGLIVKFGSAIAKIVRNPVNQIIIKVPPNAMTGPINIEYPTRTITSNANFAVNTPTILLFTPQEMPIGYPVTITTNVHFYDTTGLTVKFGNVQAIVDSVNDSVVVANVPKNAVTAPLTITWKSLTIQSSANFTTLNLLFTKGNVEFGNLPFLIKKDSSYTGWLQINDHDYQNISGSGTFQFNKELNKKIPDPSYHFLNTCLFNSLNGDTTYLGTKGTGSSTASITYVLDTSQDIIRFFHARENDITASNDSLTEDITLYNIPYQLPSNGFITLYLSEHTLQQYFAECSYFENYIYYGTISYNYGGEFTSYDTVFTINQLPFTDSSYVRITLSP